MARVVVKVKFECLQPKLFLTTANYLFQINNQSCRYFILSLHIQGAYELSADSYNIVFPSQKRSVKVYTSVNIIFSNVFVFCQSLFMFSL